MEKDVHIPEIRVQINQPSLSDDRQIIKQLKQDTSKTDLRICIDTFNLSDNQKLWVHKSPNQTIQLPVPQDITVFDPLMPHAARIPVAPTRQNMQNNSNTFPSTSINNISTPTPHDNAKSTSSPSPLVTGLPNVHISGEAPIVSGYNLQERASSPDELTCDSGLDDLSMAEEDRLRLYAACLEGRLSVYGREADTWLRERAELSAEAASLRRRLEVTQSNELEVKGQADQKVADALAKSREAFKSLRSLQEQLTSKAEENEALSTKLTAAFQDSVSLKSQLLDIQQTCSGKDQALTSLKEKMAELYADLESFRFAHSQAIDSNTDVNAELESLRRSQEWYREQLQLTQVARDRLETELSSMRKWLDQSGTSAQQLAQENARLETQVLSSEAALAEAKRNLSRQLEAIRADIVEREAIFEKMSLQRKELETMCIHKSNQITESQNRVSALQSDLTEMELEISGLRSSLNHLKHILQGVETERDNLRLTVGNLEAQLTHQKSLVETQTEQYRAICAKLARVENNNHELTGNLNKALEEKTTLEASLQATYKERFALDGCLNQLKTDMSRVESNFSSLQRELEFKNAELSAVLSGRDEILSDLDVVQCTLQEKVGMILKLEAECEHLQNALLTLRTENEGLRDDIKRLEASIGSACEEACNKARQPLLAEIEMQKAFSGGLCDELRGLRDQVANLRVEQERYCDILSRHQELQERYDCLNTSHISSVEQALARQSELCQKLKTVEASYSQTLLEKSSEINVLTLQLDGKNKEIILLQSEISSLKVHHQNALAQQSKDLALCLSDHESRLLEAESQRSEVERQLQTVLARERNTIAQHQQEIHTFQEQVTELESCLSKYKGVEIKHRQLLGEFELMKGRELGLSDTVEGLKRHTVHLEDALAQRQADMTELLDRTERVSLAANNPVLAVVEEPPLCSVQWQQTVHAAPPMPCFSCQQLTTEVASHQDATSRLQIEMAKIQAALELARQELAAQSAKTANEVFSRQQAHEARRQVLKEAEQLKHELAETREALTAANRAVQVAQTDGVPLKLRSDAKADSSTSEIKALQSVIQAMTDHLESLKKELSDAKQEAWHYQSQLFDLRGGLRGLIEQSRLFDTEATTSTLNAVDSSELEKLLVDRAEDSLLQSKPLVRVNNYLERLQQEIDSLEDQVIQHAAVVKSSVMNWRSLEEQAVLIQNQEHQVVHRNH